MADTDRVVAASVAERLGCLLRNDPTFPPIPPTAEALRILVSRLRGHCTAAPTGPWTGFSSPPSLHALLAQTQASGAAAGVLAPQAMTLGRIAQVRGGSALVHVLGVWAEGTRPAHTAPTSVAAASPPLVAVLHGTRARPDCEVVFGGADGTVRLPSWAVEGATLVAVVVSASNGRVALSLRQSDVLQDDDENGARALLGLLERPSGDTAKGRVAVADGGAVGRTLAKLASTLASEAAAAAAAAATAAAPGGWTARGEPAPSSAALSDASSSAALSAALAAASSHALCWAPTLEEALQQQRCYHDPRAPQRMLKAIGLPPLLSALPVGSAAAVARAGAYVAVREAQNAHWASETVALGIAHAKAGRLREALAAYEHALALDSTPRVLSCASRSPSRTAS